MERLDVNIVTTSTAIKDEDIFLVFGDFLEGEPIEVIKVDKNLPMSTLLKDLKIFTSSSQARKAGWDSTIPLGFSQFIVGKKKHVITIWNPSETENNIEE